MEDLNILLKDIKIKLFLDHDDFKRGLAFYTDHNQNSFDRLSILLHLFMIHSSFIPVDDNDATDIFISITKEKNHTKLIYNQIEVSSNNNCFNSYNNNSKQFFQLKKNLTIIIIKSGNSQVVINLKHDKFISEFLNIELNHQLDKLDLRKLENDFKAKCLNPFKFAFKDFKLINGMMDLPAELHFRIVLQYLNIEAVMALMKTSKYFYRILNSEPTSCDSMWFQLFKRDWDKYDSLKKEWVSTSSAINFRSDYIKNYRRNKRTDSFLYPPRSFRNFN